MNQSWIEKEFKELSLGDKRLTDRFLKTMSAFDLRPEGCINRVFKDEKAARKATYRLFDNDNFSADKILECHSKMTAERMKGEKVVLSLHDSSYFSYNTKPSIEGLGNIGGSRGKEETKGFIGHYALAVTEKGLPLGIQAIKTWSRAYESEWDKESERWVELLEEAETTYSEDTQMIFVADREADQFKVLYDTHNRGHSFVIRSKYDRMIQGEDYYLSWHMERSKKQFEITIELPHKKKKVIDAYMKFGDITINDTDVKTNRHLAQKGVRNVTLGVIEVRAKSGQGEDDLKWVLYTNLELKDKKRALEIVNYYRLRWQIENYFKILKDGSCKVEHCCLRSYEKLTKYNACFSIIAWRLFWIKFIGQIDGHLPAKAVLTDIEVEVLKNRHPDKIDKRKFKVSLAIKLIAMFGGYNNRKGDGPPGNTTLWRGFIILRERAQYHEELLIAGKLKK